MKEALSPSADAVNRLLAAMDLSQCDGCDDCSSRCAGPVPMTFVEYEAICAHLGISGDTRTRMTTKEAVERHGDDTRPEAWDTPCRFRDATRGRCRVYPVRPLVCRLMGHVPWLPCPVDRVACLPPLTLIQQALDEYCHHTRLPFHAWTAVQESEG